MADQVPPNLDDGETWFPSNFFFNEVPSEFRPRHHHHHHRLPHSCMDDLADQFASLFLPKQQQNLPSNLERSKPPVGHAPVSKIPLCTRGGNSGGFEVGQRLQGFADGSFSGGSNPVYEFQSMKPIRIPVDGDLGTRAIILQRQQNRLLRNRVLPFHGSGFGLGGGPVRESGGTGVFHPRIVTNAPSDPKRRQGMRNRHAQEIQITQHLNSLGTLGVSNQEDCHYHLPSEMGLPRSYY
ncbi:hypothetical protein SLE2022_125110 [Rubroshorea leprosula]